MIMRVATLRNLFIFDHWLKIIRKEPADCAHSWNTSHQSWSQVALTF